MIYSPKDKEQDGDENSIDIKGAEPKKINEWITLYE